MDLKTSDTENPFPDVLPLFPLNGIVLIPGGELPLNVFEPRYLSMVEDALKTDERMIGIIQPALTDNLSYLERDMLSPDTPVPLYSTGGVGRITSFSETDDGRYLITLKGLRRFNLLEELPLLNGYRRARVSWKNCDRDNENEKSLTLDRDTIKNLLSRYFNQNEICCDWDIIDKTPDEQLITCLSMICPFGPQEKQALLEAENVGARAEKLMTILQMAVCSPTTNQGCH